MLSNMYLLRRCRPFYGYRGVVPENIMRNSSTISLQSVDRFQKNEKHIQELNIASIYIPMANYNTYMEKRIILRNNTVYNSVCVFTIGLFAIVFYMRTR